MRRLDEEKSGDEGRAHRVSWRAHEYIAGLKTMGLLSSPYLADIWLDPRAGCVRTVAWATVEYQYLHVRLAFADPAVYSSRGKGEAVGTPLRYDNATQQPDSEPSTAGCVCAPALVGAAAVSVTASLEFDITWNSVTSFSSAVSLPTTAVPVPLPPRFVEVAMCTFVGLDLHIIPAWVAYWHAMGVGHFYLYVSIPEVGEARMPRSVLAAVDAGLVTLIDMDLPYSGPVRHSMLGQMIEITSCLHRYRSTARRMAFFDTDEFVVLGRNFLGDLRDPTAGPGNATDTLMSLLERHARPCTRFPAAMALALNDLAAAAEGVAFDAEGSLRLEWLAHHADWLTGPPDPARSKYIVDSTEASLLGIHRSLAYPMDCVSDGTSPSDAWVLHAMNIKAYHQSFTNKDEGKALRRMTEARKVWHNPALARMLVNHTVTLAPPLPRARWPSQLGVNRSGPFYQPAQHQWRRRRRR